MVVEKKTDFSKSDQHVLNSHINNSNEENVNGKDDVDIFRDTPVRYLGYTNEIGESFRAQIPVSLVRLTYVIASGYVCADAYHKGAQAAKLPWPSSEARQMHISHAVLDTLIWQGLASVAIPGFTINRICYLANRLLKASTTLPSGVRKWTTTAIGLGCIPFIIKPIDKSVDFMMNNSVRQWYHIEKVEQNLVHHTRND